MKKHLMPVALATSILLQPLTAVLPLHVEASTQTGIVQLWQEVPSGQKMPKGMTEKELKEQLYCRLNHTLTPATPSQNYNTYINSCYVDDVLYLGESGDQFKVYVSGYEGWVDKQKSAKIKLSFNVNDREELVPEGTPGSQLKDYEYTVYTTARFLETSDTSKYSLARQSSLKEGDYVKYEGDYVKSADSFETSSAKRSIRQGVIQSPSYYSNEKGQLVHYISENVTKSNAYTKTVIGLAPSWMKSNEPYYSYDGIYFYTSLADIDPSGAGAVNESNPYYNYYQYLSTRSQSRLSGESLDQYTALKGYQKTPSATSVKANESQLVGTGKSFERSQSEHGVNQTLQYAMAIHESAFGRSSLSVKKNNLFGMNAADLDPTGQSSAFPSVEEGILHHAEAYLSKGYTDPLSDSRYYGAHLGNKGSGMNVKYSSDPYWGEKIAGIYHQIDKANNYVDLNYYQLGVIEDESMVAIYQEPSLTSPVFYQLRNNHTKENFKHSPLLIVGETGDFYQVKTDTPINEQGLPQFDARYQWASSTGYVLKSAVNHLLEGTYIQGETSDVTLEKPTYLPTVSQTTETKERRQVVAEGKILTNSLRVRSGKGTNYRSLGSLKKGQTVSILEVGSEWHKISFNNQIGYISAAYVDVQKVSNEGDSSTSTAQTGTVTTDNLKVRTGAGTSHSILGSLKKGTSIEIVEVGTSWHRIKYGTGYGYVSADYVKLNDSTTNSSNTNNSTSKTPAIQFEKELVIELGTEPDLLEDVSVVNVGSQGYILDIRQSNLDLTQTGTYQLEYVAKYGENFANELTKVRTVVVQDTQAPKLTLKGDAVITLKIGEPYQEYGASVSDNSGELIKYYISDHQFDTSVQGVYKVKYTATDASGNTSSITREVRVQDPNAPILTLKGETYMVLRGGAAYEEPGYTAVDGNGNPLKVTVIGAEFDASKEGQYTIEYIAETKEGLKAVATRVVVVKEVPSIPEDPFIGTGKPTINNLNVRAGRGTSYKIIGKLNSLDVVNVYDLIDDWYHIDLDGTEGYVHQDYLTFTEKEKPSTPELEEEAFDQTLPITPDTEEEVIIPEEVTPEEEEANEPSLEEENPASTPAWMNYLIIGFGVCVTITVGLLSLLLFHQLKAKKMNENPNIHRRPSDEENSDSSFPPYY